MIEYKGWRIIDTQIKCDCGQIFCFKCCKEKTTEDGEGHYPASCAQYQWFFFFFFFFFNSLKLIISPNKNNSWLNKMEGGVYQFRKKPCPNPKCRAAIIKCGCPANNVICQDKNYCPNQACNRS